MLAAPRAAIAQAASCGWYADTAIKQQQQNELQEVRLRRTRVERRPPGPSRLVRDAEPGQLEGPGAESRAQARRLQTLIHSRHS